jgi:hypothetical protein
MNMAIRITTIAGTRNFKLFKKTYMLLKIKGSSFLERFLYRLRMPTIRISNMVVNNMISENVWRKLNKGYFDLL